MWIVSPNFHKAKKESDNILFCCLIRRATSSDPLPFQFLSREPELCDNARFIDIDHYKLMLEKCNALRTNKTLRDIVPDAELISGEDAAVLMRGKQYLSIGCDLGDLRALETALRSEMDTTKFSIICTAEVSLTYMDVKAADALINWASRLSDGKA